MLHYRQRIIAELWRHYDSIGYEPATRLATLIFLIDPIQVIIIVIFNHMCDSKIFKFRQVQTTSRNLYTQCMS